jgi:signal transduction histidine kinase
MPSPTEPVPPLPLSERERARLTALLDALPSAAALFAPAGTLVALNQRARDLFVVDPLAPLESQHWRVVLQPLGAAAADGMAAAKARAPLETRTVPFGTSGTIVDLRITIFDSDLLLVSAVDATDREQRRAALERADRELATIFELTPSSVRVVDMDGRIRRQNTNAEREHTERQPATVRELWELDAPHCVQHVRPQPFLDSPAMKAFAGITVSRQLLEVRRLGTTRTIEAYAAPMRDANGQVCGVVLLDRDVTDREQLSRLIRDREVSTQSVGSRLDEAELQRLVEERSRDLLAAQEDTVRERRLAAIGQLAAGVMHDLNNALNPIMAAAYLLRHHAESPDAVRDYADRIKTAAEIGAATASRVGRFIRQDPVHAGGDEETDLSVLVSEVLDLTEPSRQRLVGDAREVRVVRQLGQEVRTRGLPGEIREALLNLVQNAMDAMPNGGTLTVRTAVEGQDACVFMRDTGVGMTAEVRERAFEPFFTTKGRKGSGLGLAEVYGIMRRNRGTVHLSSEPGRGTEVVLRLPALQTKSVPTPPLVPAVTTPQRILVVEDHDDGREFLRRILQGDGHTVEAVGTCADARDRLTAEDPPPYDILLTDVGLPDGSGWDLVAFARAHAPGLRIGVITGWEPAADTSEAQGAEFVLRKPLRATELKAHIAGGYSPTSSPE